MNTVDGDQAALESRFERALEQGAAAVRACEIELIAQARAGSQAAFAVLYRYHVTAVYRYCWLRLEGQKDEVEDLTSRVFLRAWQSIGKYDERGRPFLAWLHTIARNLVIDHLRQQGRTVSIDETLPAPGNMAEDAVLRSENDELRAALDQLTPEQRNVVIYHYVLGYRSEEIAAIMGKRAGAIRALQMRGLKALRAILRRNGE